MSGNLEPYAKENNILQLGLFDFGRKKKKRMVTKWEDEAGEISLVCSAEEYGVPGSFEQDIYTAVMRLWIKQGMSKSVVLNYSDIVKELGLGEPRNWVSRVKKGLKCLAMARYEFKKCFLQKQEDGLEKITAYFSLFSSASLFDFDKKGKKNKRNSESYLVFPAEIQRNLDKKYYQILDMSWYRKLKDGLPRRLYEYLDKKRYLAKKGKFSISEKLICQWLPITDKNTTTRRKTLEKTVNNLIKAKYLAGYSFDKKKKICTFQYSYRSSSKKIDTTLNHKDKYKEIRLWLDKIPYLRKTAIEEILIMENIESIYIDVRSEYERQKANIKSKPGWIRNAFQKRYKMAISEENLTREQVKLKVLAMNSKTKESLADRAKNGKFGAVLNIVEKDTDDYMNVLINQYLDENKSQRNIN
jgi:hypothetical protein